MEKEFDFLNDKALCVINDTEPCVIKYNGETIRKLSAIKSTEQGTTEVTYNSEYKKNLLNMAFEGNTEQKQYEGYNLFDISNYLTHSVSLLFDISHLVRGKKYTFKSNKPISWFKISTNQQGSDSVLKNDITNGLTTFTFTMSRHANISESEIQYLILGTLENITEGNSYGVVTDISQLNGYELQIVEGTVTKPYEPYVGGIPSPNVEYPQPIENSTNVSAELSGVNLLDYTKSRGMQNIKVTQINNGLIIEKGNGTIVTSYGMFAEIKENTTYTLQLLYSVINSATTRANELLLYYSNNISASTTGDKLFSVIPLGSSEEFALKSPRFTTGTGYKYLKISYFGSVTQTVPDGFKATLKDIMLTESDTVQPYQPYFTPTKVDIPSEVTLADGTVVPLRFAKLGTVNNVAINKADTLTIDKISNKVTYTQYLDLYRPKAPYNFQRSYYNYANTGVYFVSAIPQKSNRQSGICSHGGRVGNCWSSLDIWVGVSSTVVYWLGIITRLGYDADWVDKTKPTTEEWAIAKEKMQNWFAEQEANGTPFEVLYELFTPIEYNLTNTDLGQQLLTLANNTQNATNIINISADVPVSKLNVDYAIWGGRENENN